MYRRGKIDLPDMERALTSINETASYFGDPVLKHAQIEVRLFGIESHPIKGQIDASMQKQAPIVVIMVRISSYPYLEYMHKYAPEVSPMVLFFTLLLYLGCIYGRFRGRIVCGGISTKRLGQEKNKTGKG